jgi:hypothetical protein
MASASQTQPPQEPPLAFCRAAWSLTAIEDWPFRSSAGTDVTPNPCSPICGGSP